MNFTTTFEIAPSKTKVSLKSKIVTIGSCFSDVVGSQLIDNKINVTVNPFGTLFNPSSIFKLLNQSIDKSDIVSEHFVEREGVWFHYDFHSKHNSINKEDLKSELKLAQNEVFEKLQTADFLVITLGTSYAYQLLTTKKYVANCHKAPASLFKKELLHVKHICQEFELFYSKIKKINPSLNIVLTVSPVRHIKDGIPENQLSKSILRAACHYLCLDFEGVSYFPSYEIMVDELRDYRFYKSDLIHPNEQAENYIFERFSNTYFDENLMEFLRDWSKIKSDINHRSFSEKSESHQKFLKILFKKLEKISEIVEVEKEKEAVLSRIFAENSKL